ncbi:DUF4190 domain-containing protein [Rhodococcus sp. T7]|uniref:DUF4190 domain-containing protein n=1 Tax=Rhodococcus sp. T7 TaxID=627444 RepID=UPI001F294F0D|nr:DUF4190 domain-containing protein [Rhodococcus sp. T7]
MVEWLTRVIGVGATVVAVMVFLALVFQFTARLWAQNVAGFTNGESATAVMCGVCIGAVCTLVALFSALIGSLSWQRRGGPAVAVLALLLAFTISLPNIMTLTIVLGTGNASRAGVRILDMDAPGFLAAWKGAAIVGAGFYLVLTLVMGRTIRTVLGPNIRKIGSTRSADPIGYTADGQPIYSQVGFTPDGQPVFSNQIQGQVITSRAGQTNTLAIVALILGIVSGFIAIPFGHVARRQIRRTGERGAGMALAGLIFGYLSLAAIVAVVVLVVATAANAP